MVEQFKFFFVSLQVFKKNQKLKLKVLTLVILNKKIFNISINFKAYDFT